MENDFRETEIIGVEKVLKNIGFQMCESDGSYRPFNEVMIDLGKAIKQLRETSDEKQFEIMRDHIYSVLVGVRYKNQFKF